ncbi:hypothetical protein X975_13678, partial [Stegodyphus mimosarum]
MICFLQFRSDYIHISLCFCIQEFLSVNTASQNIPKSSVELL